MAADSAREAAREKLCVTTREREVLVLLSRGMTNSQIARDLWISSGTVRKHLENIYSKLGVRNRAGAVAWFLGAGGIQVNHHAPPVISDGDRFRQSSP